jgi:plastocyanin
MKDKYNKLMVSRAFIATSILTLILFIIGIGIACQSPALTTPSPATSPTTPSEQTSGTSAKVTISGFAFNPAQLEITVGTTVTWDNNDQATHTVTARDNSFNSGDMPFGTSFSNTFEQSGVFEYYCQYHSYMVGKITVK